MPRVRLGRTGPRASAGDVHQAVGTGSFEEKLEYYVSFRDAGAMNRTSLGMKRWKKVLELSDTNVCPPPTTHPTLITVPVLCMEHLIECSHLKEFSSTQNQPWQAPEPPVGHARSCQAKQDHSTTSPVTSLA